MSSLEHNLVLEEKKEVSRDTYVLTFSTQNIPQAQPGQFFNLATPYYLRRPLGVLRQSADSISFGIKVVGKGTQALSQLRPGEHISALGPLGRGYDLRRVEEDSTVMLVGGGTGVFPLLYMAQRADEGAYTQKICQIYGFRSPEDSFLINEARSLCTDTIMASDSGGLDLHGNAVAALEVRLASLNEVPAAIFTCGPEPLMKGVIAVCKREGIPVQASLETRMGCGTGLCRGCSVDLIDEKAATGFRRVRCCTEGPVFPGEAIIWR